MLSFTEGFHFAASTFRFSDAGNASETEDAAWDHPLSSELPT